MNFPRAKTLAKRFLAPENTTPSSYRNPQNWCLTIFRRINSISRLFIVFSPMYKITYKNALKTSLFVQIYSRKLPRAVSKTKRYLRPRIKNSNVRIVKQIVSKWFYKLRESSYVYETNNVYVECRHDQPSDGFDLARPFVHFRENHYQKNYSFGYRNDAAIKYYVRA